MQLKWNQNGEGLIQGCGSEALSRHPFLRVLAWLRGSARFGTAPAPVTFIRLRLLGFKKVEFSSDSNNTNGFGSS